MKKGIKILSATLILFSMMVPLSVVHAYQINGIYPAVPVGAFSPCRLSAMFVTPGAYEIDPSLCRSRGSAISADNFLWGRHETPAGTHPFGGNTYDTDPAVSVGAFSSGGFAAMPDTPRASMIDPNLWRFYGFAEDSDNFLRGRHEVPIYQHPLGDTTYQIGYLVWNSAANRWESERITDGIPLAGISRKEFIDYWEAIDPGQPGDETHSRTPVPEPSTLLLLGVSIFGLACSRHQIKR